MSTSFLGQGWKFPIQVNATTGRIELVSEEEDIAEAIRLIMWTAKGERVMRPQFGCGVQEFLFGNSDEATMRLMEGRIKDALRMWEPRIHEVDIRIAAERGHAEKWNISIQYRIRSTNNLYNRVYPFYLQEGAK